MNKKICSEIDKETFQKVLWRVKRKYNNLTIEEEALWDNPDMDTIINQIQWEHRCNKEWKLSDIVYPDDDLDGWGNEENKRLRQK
jgi:hypothetical protein